jgi:hypothetical protein
MISDVRFSRFIRADGFYTRADGGRSGPAELTGEAHPLDGLSSLNCDEVGRAVSLAGMFSSVEQRRRTDPEVAKAAENETLKSVLRFTEDSPAGQAATRILAAVQGSLGGLPVSFGQNFAHHMEDGMFACNYHQAEVQGGAYRAPVTDDGLYPAFADGTVYIDTKNNLLYVHPEPTDPRWK